MLDWWIKRFPSRVGRMCLTMPAWTPPDGIAQLWKVSVAGSKRTSASGRTPDSSVPDHAIYHREGIRMGFRPARRGPFLNRSGFRIEPTEPPPRRVHEPDHPVVGDVEPPDGRVRVGERELGQFHCRRIYFDQAIAAVACEPRKSVRIDLDAVGPRALGRYGHELRVAGRRIKPAHHVALLEREPEDTLVVEYCGVRIARSGVGHLEDGDFACRRIEPADRPIAVPRVPDVSAAIEFHRVRQRIRGQRIFLHPARRGIDPPDEIAELPRPPDGPVRRLDWIARPLAKSWDLPFLERDLGVSRDQRRRPRGVGGKVLRQIADDRVPVIRAPGEVDHRAGQLLPAIAGIARAARDLTGLVAPGADGFDQLLASSFG